MLTEWERRAELGERLATEFEDGGDRAQVIDLLLDRQDTAVTFRTAVALLERRDRVGVELIVAAQTHADDDSSQWLAAAVNTFLGRFVEADEDFLRATLGELAAGADAAPAEAAAEMLSYHRL